MNRTRLITLVALLVTVFLGGCGNSSSPTQPPNTLPNILFVVMDDVGIDQMLSFGYGGNTPPSMPNINAIASAGVRFRNTWSMPECSPGRASMFVGRYPFRTNVYGAIGQDDLANSQVSPYDMTTPKLLKQANYESGMFGKFHLAGPDNNQAGNGTPAALGWDYFYGWLGADPHSIDTTAGGVTVTTPATATTPAKGPYKCGFVPDAAHGGANSGACYLADNSCSNISGASAAGDVPGKQCLITGGIFKPSTICQNPPPAGLNFDTENAYYVSPLVINGSDGVQSVPVTDSRNRGYRTTIEANAAIGWIKSRSTSRPWMASVTFSSPHTPFQQAPSSLTPSTVGGGDGLDCLNPVDQRVLQNQVTEAMDTEFGRLLVETGLAQRKPDGTLLYDPKASNTMIVIVGDNGTFGATVKPPFSPPRAKGTAYQTGVWVPLIVAGPLVVAQNRDVEHMVNMVDVYRLFGEIAGIDVATAVPRTIDAAPLLPYLTKADQSSIRTLNFTMGAYNLQVNGARNGPCLISTTCTQTPLTKAVCESNGGIWWGAGYTDPSVVVSTGHGSITGYQTCCQVNQALFKNGSTQVGVQPIVTTAIRNKDFKLVQNTNETYDPVSDSCSNIIKNEFYAVNQNVPLPALDNPALDLIPSQGSWPASLTAIYNSLLAQLTSILASQPACPGDGNMDGVVDAQDSINLQTVSQTWGLSSVYDWNLDGITNNTDSQPLGICPPSTAVY
jgi:hypothetical protein